MTKKTMIWKLDGLSDEQFSELAEFLASNNNILTPPENMLWYVWEKDEWCSPPTVRIARIIEAKQTLPEKLPHLNPNAVGLRTWTAVVLEVVVAFRAGPASEPTPTANYHRSRWVQVPRENIIQLFDHLKIFTGEMTAYPAEARILA
jgi:hypothetical protein